MANNAQRGLFDFDGEPEFDGTTYEPEFDHERLHGQLAAVYNVVRDGAWHTLAELAAIAHGSEAGVSARLRDLRKHKFGRHTIERRRSGDPTSGLWEYRMPKTMSNGQENNDAQIRGKGDAHEDRLRVGRSDREKRG